MKGPGALHYPGIARLGLAGLLSEIGDWVLMIALPIYVLQLTGSPFLTAVVFVLELVPTIVAGPFVGVLVDRYERWRLMAAVAAAQAALLLPLLAVDDRGDLWLICAVVVVQSVLGTVIEPARNTAAAASVPAEDRLAVNTALGMLSSLARLVGGPLGGLLLGLGSIRVVVLVDVVSFIAAATLFALSRPRQEVRDAPAVDATSPSRLIEDWREGMTVVLRTPVLRRTLVVIGGMGLAQGAFVVLFVLFVVRDLNGDEAAVGLLRGVQAIGALAGGLVLGMLARRLDAARLLAGSLLAFGLLSLLIWNAPLLTTAMAVYIGAFIAVGLPGLASLTSVLTLLQTYSADSTRGRVLSTAFAVYGGAQALGMLAAGSAGAGADLTWALQVQGVVYLSAGALAFTLPRGVPAPARQPVG